MTGHINKIKTYLLLLFVFFVVIAGGSVCLGAGGIYSWIDKQGIRHYSNVAPSTSGVNVESFPEDGAKYQSLPSGTRDGILFKAVKIYDGDSLKVSGAGLTLMVRLVGIDAPETGGGKHSPQPFSRKAKNAFSRMISHTPFTLKSYGTGGYNRVLAELFVGNQNINLQLIRQGLAEVYRGKMQPGLDKKAYLAAQKEARLHRRGIWSLGKAYESPRLWRRKHPRN
ncbi:Endonuclease YncB, thermonuclease family [Desulfocicer vacuolatum DSM 3385]|uniref:Endonuclease YncB, thermonuclease family n=1 Tax=Desulfocicer vacuolatum DSM 3385 TaxID=1121400 RepID=A0A1W2A651_9BACT|nr:thermonuclease family protein [Desulfocicer vacuolatum]SMC56219.1 Endonuclease YncB, thermonuclease family [Desulfocicer vacuolatum DSM 3385]